MKRVIIFAAILTAAISLIFLRIQKSSDKRQVKSGQIASPLSPAPTEGMTAQQKDLFDKYSLGNLKLPQGFRIAVFAEVPTARSLAVSPSGVVYVGNREQDKVFALVDENHDGFAEKKYVVASGLHVPNGVAFKDGTLYITTISQILKIPDVEKDLANPPRPEVVYGGYPSDEHHGWKFIGFGPDNRLYVPVGAPCNDCHVEDPYGTITKYDLKTNNYSVVARGIRNTVGFDWNPVTHELWFTDNGVDNLGNDIPADELNVITISGEHFGFPYCHQGDYPDPNFAAGKKCSDFAPPAGKLAPHTAALGMRFYTGSMFPPEYKNQIFIAEHGSQFRSPKIGYRVMLAKTDNVKMLSYSPFLDGFLQGDSYTGRPVDVAVMKDGSLLVSDDYAGAVYRISYNK